MPSDTIGALFLRTLATYPERRFVRHLDQRSDTRWTYVQASRSIAAAVERLNGMGVRRGHRIVCYLEDMVPSAFFQLACAHLGVATVYLSPLFSPDLVQRIGRRLDSDLAFTTEAHAQKLEGRGLRLIVDRPEHADLDPGRAREILERAAGETSGDDLYMMQPTSGSTGEPKLAMRTHRSLVRSARHHSLRLTAESEPPQRILMVASLTHAFGQSILLTAVRLGAELSVPDAVDVQCSLPIVRALDPTYLLMPPRVLRAFHQQNGSSTAARLFGPSARLFQFTGAPGDADLLAMLQSQGVDVVEMYGSTETGQLAMTIPGKWRPGAVGPPLDDVVLRIADDGELLARSPGCMLGYFGDEQLTNEAFTEDGFYRTGDFAEMTGDGLLRVLGRKRDVFNTQDGANVYPGRVEAMLEALGWVHQVVLIGDQRPYLVALIACKSETKTADTEDGLLDPKAQAAIYAAAHADIAAINRKLEPNERIRRFMIFGRPMAPGLCERANLGKTRRDRRAVASVYSARIAELYAPSIADAFVVPGN